MTFTAQELNRKIAIERRVDTQTGTGDIVTTWVPFASPYAKVEPVVGRELWAAQQTQAAAPVKFTIRYLAGLVPSMRIVWNGMAHDITSINNIKAGNREVLIYATAGVNSG